MVLMKSAMSEKYRETGTTSFTQAAGWRCVFCGTPLSDENQGAPCEKSFVTGIHNFEWLEEEK